MRDVCFVGSLGCNRQISQVLKQTVILVDWKDDGEKLYFIKNTIVKYLKSASLLKILRQNYQKDRETNNFIGFGDPVYDYENFKQGKPEKGSMKISATEDTEITEGVAPPTYYCSRNTQVQEEKSWDKNKTLQHSNPGNDQITNHQSPTHLVMKLRKYTVTVMPGPGVSWIVCRPAAKRSNPLPGSLKKNHKKV